MTQALGHSLMFMTEKFGKNVGVLVASGRPECLDVQHGAGRLFPIFTAIRLL